jgi:hypothetical protein
MQADDRKDAVGGGNNFIPPSDFTIGVNPSVNGYLVLEEAERVSTGAVGVRERQRTIDLEESPLQG